MLYKRKNWLIRRQGDLRGHTTKAWASLVLSGEECACQCRRYGFSPWVGKIPGEGNGNSLQYSCLGNPLDRGACWTKVHRVTKELDMTWWLNNSKDNSLLYYLSSWSLGARFDHLCVWQNITILYITYRLSLYLSNYANNSLTARHC